MPEKKATKTAAKSPKRAAKKPADKAEGEAAVREKIAAMPEPFRGWSERLHAMILRVAPHLQPTVWYGMPGYRKDGDIVCFFRGKLFPGEEYMTFGLTQKASFPRSAKPPHQLLESAWFIAELDDVTEARLADIVRAATS